MARAWVYDRTNDNAYVEAVKKAKAAKRTPPARWMVRYYDPAGRLKSGGTFKKKPDAEKRQSEIEASLHEGTYRNPQDAKVTLESMAEKWLSARTDIKPSTWWKYRGLLDAHVLPRWGELRVSAIHTEDIAVWVAELQKPREEGGANLGASQTRHAQGVLSMILDWCVPRRLPANPARGVPLPKPSEAEHVYLNHVQVETLANAAGGLRTKYGQIAAAANINRALILLLAYTGLRFNEAAALRVGKVDLDTRRIRVTVAFGEVEGKLIEQSPKTGKSRTVPIAPFLVPELKPLIDDRPDDALVFSTRRGAPVRLRNWRRREFAQAMKTAKLDGLGLTPHKLRHTAASLAIAAGADVKVVQSMLGHATATMTLDRYGHLFPDRLDEVAEAMDAARGKATAHLPALVGA
ncbi:tyrosine-type recombinase/integrase [Marinitenerispora sediminis]|uniref:Recombinase XerD n=1 Tax=Marinitenerispora sediminis TaxID=1931232 RepID=A0A368T550_9ACTN|nr:site-specific integrase [Marinitenerispora sediminis]RCV49838.1 recombinase XerD [Marinitenerispora sediminis]RCV53916.1 recombinase XerD [Marinitenerispora sediminis]RCV58389.1 recombinase XerD [Marinitenerispora sediminis]